MNLTKEEYLNKLDNSSCKELLNSLDVQHKPIYTKDDITPENEKWIRVLLKADEIFEKLEKNKLN